MQSVETNEITQRNGMVHVVWNLSPETSPATSPTSGSILPALPPKQSSWGGEYEMSRISENRRDNTNIARVLETYSHVIDSMPVRIVALHYCGLRVDQESTSTSRATDCDESFRLGYGNDFRFRSHVGTSNFQEECCWWL